MRRLADDKEKAISMSSEHRRITRSRLQRAYGRIWVAGLVVFVVALLLSPYLISQGLPERVITTMLVSLYATLMLSWIFEEVGSFLRRFRRQLRAVTMLLLLTIVNAIPGALAGAVTGAVYSRYNPDRLSSIVFAGNERDGVLSRHDGVIIRSVSQGAFLSLFRFALFVALLILPAVVVFLGLVYSALAIGKRTYGQWLLSHHCELATLRRTLDSSGISVGLITAAIVAYAVGVWFEP